MAATREGLEAVVARLEAERLKPSPRDETTTEDLIRRLVHVLACALGHGRAL